MHSFMPVSCLHTSAFRIRDNPETPTSILITILKNLKSIGLFQNFKSQFKNKVCFQNPELELVYLSKPSARTGIFSKSNVYTFSKTSIHISAFWSSNFQLRPSDQSIFQFPISNFKFQISRFQVSNFPTSKFQLQISNFKFQISNFQISNFDLRVNQVPNFQFPISNFQFPISNFQFPISNFDLRVNQVPNFQFSISNFDLGSIKFQFSTFESPHFQFPISNFQISNFKFPNFQSPISKYQFPNIHFQYSKCLNDQISNFKFQNFKTSNSNFDLLVTQYQFQKFLLRETLCTRRVRGSSFFSHAILCSLSLFSGRV